jgi:hypothetical protein
MRMKTMKRAIILTSLILIIYFMLNACSNLKEAKLQDYPDFEMNAEKYVINGPFSPTFGMNTYTVENQAMNKVYKIKLKLKGTSTKTNVIDKEKKKGVLITTAQEISSNVFHVFNFKDSSEYEVGGELISHRTTEEKGKSSYETSDIISAIEFDISEKDSNVGKISIVPSMSDGQVMVIPIEVKLHENEYYIEYQNMFNKVIISFEKDLRLIALFALKPASSFITTKLKGDILIEQALPEDIKSDIFTIYLIVEGMLSHKDI